MGAGGGPRISGVDAATAAAVSRKPSRRAGLTGLQAAAHAERPRRRRRRPGIRGLRERVARVTRAGVLEPVASLGGRVTCSRSPRSRGRIRAN